MGANLANCQLVIHKMDRLDHAGWTELAADFHALSMHQEDGCQTSITFISWVWL